MVENDAENEFDSFLTDVTPADRIAMAQCLRAIAAQFNAARANIEQIIADCNPNLAAQSWDAAGHMIQTARGRARQLCSCISSSAAAKLIKPVECGKLSDMDDGRTRRHR